MVARIASRWIRRLVAGKYDHIDFKPPQSVADTAKKGLEYRQKANPSDRGGLTPAEASEQGVGSGVQRAVNLKNRDTLSPETVKRMKAFFARHKKNKTIEPEHRDEPWNDKGYVSWLIWGGDAGKAWADKIVGQMEKADKESKKASENEPTNPDLWEKVKEEAKGKFQKWPSAYASGWAVQRYNEKGGGWRKKADLSEWFSGHGKDKGTARGGDWVAISPIKKTLQSGKKVEPGDIVGPCGISDDPDWEEYTKGGEDPLKCMPRQKAYDMPKKERAEKAKGKAKAEREEPETKSPTRTPTFKDASKRLWRVYIFDNRGRSLFEKEYTARDDRDAENKAFKLVQPLLSRYDAEDWVFEPVGE